MASAIPTYGVCATGLAENGDFPADNRRHLGGSGSGAHAGPRLQG